MPGDELRLAVGELFGDRARLLRIAGVVADLQRQLLAEHAAGGVDVGDRLLGAVLSSAGRSADSEPVIGPATATRMSCASAAVDNSSDAPNARLMSLSGFMDTIPDDHDELPSARLRRTRRSAAFSADLGAKSSAYFAPFQRTVAACLPPAALTVIPGARPCARTRNLDALKTAPDSGFARRWRRRAPRNDGGASLSSRALRPSAAFEIGGADFRALQQVAAAAAAA